MNIFISPSSLGYLVGVFIFLISIWKLKASYKQSRLESTKYLGISLFYLALTMFFYSLPTFFFFREAEILGWFNVIANFFLGLMAAYLIRFNLSLNFPTVKNKNIFYLSLLWVALVLTPVNIFYLPLPTFDEYNLELWNYEWPLILTVALTILVSTWFTGATLFYKFAKEGRSRIILQIATAFTIGGLGGTIIISAQTTEVVAVGYALLIIGGPVIFAFNFIK